MLLSFGDDEDEMINSVLSALEVGRRTYKMEETKILQQRYYTKIFPKKQNSDFHTPDR